MIRVGATRTSSRKASAEGFPRPRANAPDQQKPVGLLSRIKAVIRTSSVTAVQSRSATNGQDVATSCPVSSTARRRRRQRPEWRIARFTRRQPGVALWLLVFAMFGLPAAQQGLSRAKWFERDEVETGREICDDPVLLETFSRNVNDALIEIGHGVRVERVLVVRTGLHKAAYNRTDNTIFLNSELGSDEQDLLRCVSHECVHAIFTQAYLNQYAYLDPDHALRIEETTASVLGAHIAGRVVTRRGGDGASVTAEIVKKYRDDCDPKKPGSGHREFRRMQDTMHIDGHRPWQVKSLEVHYWSPRMVDEIDTICRANPDPWEAAHAVARRYRLID